MTIEIDWPEGWHVEQAPPPSGIGDAESDWHGVVVPICTARRHLRLADVTATAHVEAVWRPEDGTDAVIFRAWQVDGERDSLIRPLPVDDVEAAASHVPCLPDRAVAATSSVTYAARRDDVWVILRLERVERQALGEAMIELDDIVRGIRIA